MTLYWRELGEETKKSSPHFGRDPQDPEWGNDVPKTHIITG